MLGSPDDFDSPEDVFDAVGVVLLDSSDETTVRGFCEAVYKGFHGGQTDGGSGGVEGAKLLDAPVQLASKLKIGGNATIDWLICGSLMVSNFPPQ